ncbi:endonuclease/exonuclease/phosphatase family protein [Geomonas silvestris]|nr:endonuclease/exonuclease/phosphatase family protein [Geomonas silvestris]
MTTTISIMTYNVHSSIGMDGKISPLRIAGVIERCAPDVVALQELDSGLTRTSLVDQAHVIAHQLEMTYHFHPSFRVEEGGYGNAVLSRLPLRLVKAGPLPSHPSRSFERRGALWVEVEQGGRGLQIIATHFGLNRRERICQAEALLGPEWLEHPECRGPVVVCGDFNALPRSAAYRCLTRRLRDAQCALKGSRPQGTFPVRLPLMRIDHLFISPGVQVSKVAVPRTPLTRLASDHLPLVVTLELP